MDTNFTADQINNIVRDLLTMRRDDALIRIGAMNISEADRNIIKDMYCKASFNRIEPISKKGNPAWALLAFVIGIVALFLFYYYISIPVIPIVSIYIVAFLFSSKYSGCIARFVYTVIVTVIASWLYLTNVIYMTAFYPKYGNVLGIILEIITLAAFICCGIYCSLSVKRQ